MEVGKEFEERSAEQGGKKAGGEERRRVEDIVWEETRLD